MLPILLISNYRKCEKLSKRKINDTATRIIDGRGISGNRTRLLPYSLTCRASLLSTRIKYLICIVFIVMFPLIQIL